MIYGFLWIGLTFLCLVAIVCLPTLSNQIITYIDRKKQERETEKQNEQKLFDKYSDPNYDPLAELLNNKNKEKNENTKSKTDVDVVLGRRDVSDFM